MAKRRAKRKSAAVKYFVLMKGNRDSEHVFTARQPRAAALKAATRGFTEIKLRERGTKKIHIFKGSRKQVRAPENKPDWMPSKVWKSNVKKKGIERMEKKRRR